MSTPEEPRQLLREIAPLLETKDREGIGRLLRRERSSDIAEIIELADNDQRRLLFDVLATPVAAEVLEKVNEATPGGVVRVAQGTGGCRDHRRDGSR